MVGVIRVALAPLVRGSTYRRGVYLLLGGVVLLPYVLLGFAFAGLLRAPGEFPRALTALLLAVTVPIAVVPAFLRGTRALEIVAARGLLEVDLPDPAAAREPAGVDRETRLRSALWFALHLVTGGAVALGLVAALPMALVFIAGQFGLGAEALAGVRLGPLDEHDTLWLSLVGLALLLVVVYAVAGLGALAALMAPALLGPSPGERIAALEARAGQLAERNRLARELHDSVGHALTVTTLQAAAARRLLDRDPEFVRGALAAIEEAGRAAAEDLDDVIGLLRERDDGRPAPQPTLSDLDRLVGEARAAGLEVDVRVGGPLGQVPAVVSREGYRIVQEALTNAIRHAGRMPVSLRLGVADRTLEIDLTNPVGDGAAGAVDGAAGRGGGRGLHGMRERVALLGGRMTAGLDGGLWRVAVRLPTGGRGRP
jgi:signal transduction histidine kinase